jgi:putative GTP pyrophosphokinase
MPKEEIQRTISKITDSDIGQDSISELSDVQIREIETKYGSDFNRNKALLDEVVFILTERITAAGVKIHGIESRVKELASLTKKCQRKGMINLDDLADVVGVRVISLFRSDMSLLGKIVSENFDVIGVDDKISEDRGPLGYMSVHYICNIPSRYSGPRYENTVGIRFEIQVRTLACTHGRLFPTIWTIREIGTFLLS